MLPGLCVVDAFAFQLMAFALDLPDFQLCWAIDVHDLLKGWVIPPLRP